MLALWVNKLNRNLLCKRDGVRWQIALHQAQLQAEFHHERLAIVADQTILVSMPVLSHALDNVNHVQFVQRSEAYWQCLSVRRGVVGTRPEDPHTEITIGNLHAENLNAHVVNRQTQRGWKPMRLVDLN